jgi:phytoene desaturase
MGFVKSPTTLVIGAGVGGIVAAIHLARAGMGVTVVEKNQRPGGRCDRHDRDGHTFDSGPTLLVLPLAYEAEFRALGSSIWDALELTRVDPTYQLIFDDDCRLALTSDMAAMQQQLEAIEPGSFRGLLGYLQEGERHYRLAMERLVSRDFRRAREFFTPANMALLFQLKPLARHYGHMAGFFRSPRLKAAFTFQDVYMGLSPFEAPATFSMMPYSELAHGVWYPRGGMYRVVEVLMDIALRAGVEFAFDAEVERIEVNGTKARGVVLADGRRLGVDIVLANADLPYVYKDLLPDEQAGSRLDRKRYSCSTISFFWGVDKRFDSLGPHTLFLADDYRGNFKSIIEELDLPSNPSLYVHAPARLDPTLAPPGEDTITAIVPVGHLNGGDERDWAELRDRARQAVLGRLARAGITDLEAHLKFEVSYTPLSWRKRYNLMKGSTHGLCHTLSQLAYMRPRNRHPRYGNLYFAGASTHPGTGVPTAMVSGRLAARRVLDEM